MLQDSRFGAASAAAPLPHRATGRPNIIVFMPGELRADALGCYGNSLIRTQNFDHFARTGTRFYEVFLFGKNDVLAPASFAGSVTQWRNPRSPAEEFAAIDDRPPELEQVAPLQELLDH